LMVKEVPGSAVTVGDWLAESVNGVQPRKKGATREDVTRLRKVDAVKVKYGIPFIPPFLIAYLITLAYGNLLLYVIF